MTHPNVDLARAWLNVVEAGLGQSLAALRGIKEELDEIAPRLPSKDDTPFSTITDDVVFEELAKAVRCWRDSGEYDSGPCDQLQAWITAEQHLRRF